MNYKEAGVDIEEGYKAVGKYRELAAATASGAVLGGIGSFAGMFSLKEFIAGGAATMEEPVLVSGADGVGTKLDIAFKLKKFDTVGIDCVAMCVNDILCHGARPLFFLDYLACGKLDAEVAASLVKGVAVGCRETGVVLLGGETAEMPGFYDEGKYDIAGFAVGIVDRKKIVDGRKIREGDALLGIASSGPHSSGFSLIRKVIPDLNEDFGGMPIGQALLEPTRLYVKPVLELMNEVEIRGMAHITGGGFYENVPRMFFHTPTTDGGRQSQPEKNHTLQPDGGRQSQPEKNHTPLVAVIRDPLSPGYKGAWKVPPVFARIAYGVKNCGAKNADDSGGLTGATAQKAGEEILRSDAEVRKLMFNTYNMGIGFVLALAPGDVQKVAAFLEEKGFPAWEIGRVEKAREANDGELRFV
ncbi:MAG: phosphoribosylformylglycinamidine cyclo-ligase [Treponema sp.]|jgi:phosphoribosylformylglycinamidine cyclo-ligase|nr:phosphoribosylformylglycinamidine cyclo-ligase [Treponema sp.]